MPDTDQTAVIMLTSTIAQTVNTPIVTIAQTQASTVTVTATTTVMSTGHATHFDIPKPKFPDPPKNTSTPILNSFFVNKQGAYNFTAAPSQNTDINQCLQRILWTWQLQILPGLNQTK